MNRKDSFGNGNNFIPHLSNKLRNFFANFKPFQDNHVTSSEFSTPLSKQSLSNVEFDLEKQLSPWKENPIWDENPADIKVTVPKGSLCNLNVKVDVGLPPDAVYNIITDPDNKRVFKNIKEVISRNVLVDEGHHQIVELDQAAIWRFLWWSGTISVHVLVDQNREDHTSRTVNSIKLESSVIKLLNDMVSKGVISFIYQMKFKQIKSGFMDKFEGCWKIEPLFIDGYLCDTFKPETLKDYISCTRGKGRIASRINLEQLIQPSIIPPPPISWYVRGITTKTTEMLINDLLAEAARIRQGFEDGGGNCYVSEHDHVKYNDIKERWAITRRTKAKKPRRRLSLNSKSH